MRVKSISFNKYRRFSDLKFAGLKKTNRLVILTGPNGNGKSAFLDGINLCARRPNDTESPYDKWSGDIGNVRVQRCLVECFEGSLQGSKKAYVRTAFRHSGQFNISSLNRQPPAMEDERNQRMDALDNSISNNYTRMSWQVVEHAHSDDENVRKKATDWPNYVKSRVNNSLEQLDLPIRLNGIGNPTKNGTYFFTKDNVPEFTFENLSGGEKAAFDLILDLIARTPEFGDALYLIDEPETHLSPNVQAKLLDVLLELIPKNGQLWLATHSIGIIKKAMELYKDDPDKVAFVNLEGDFYQQREIEPIIPTRAFWEITLRNAIDDLAALVAPEQIILCEGGNQQAPLGDGLDAKIYGAIFGNEMPFTVFKSVGSCNDLEGKIWDGAQLIADVIGKASLTRLRDKDNLSSQEIEEYKRLNGKVITERNLEGIVFADEVLEKLCKGNVEHWEAISNEKQRLLKESVGRGNPVNDIKSIAGQLKTFIERHLQIVGGGENTKAFMLSTLAPLITSDTTTYENLKKDIFG